MDNLLDTQIHGASRRVLEVVSDAIGVDLEISKNGVIEGKSTFKLAIPGLGLKGRLSTRLVSSFVSSNGEDVGVILEVAGDLSIFVFASDYDSKVTAVILDKSKMGKLEFEGLFEDLSVRSWRTALKYLLRCVAGAYTRDFAEVHWQAMQL